MDPRTPVIVGGGQWTNRVDRGESPVEPVGLIAGALERAAADAAGSPDLLAAADAVRVVQLFSWRYANPAALVADRIGATPRDTALSPTGGNEPQALVNQACRDIAAGDADLVLIGGAEAWRSRQGPGGAALGWTPFDAPVPPVRRTGEEVPLSNPGEQARQVVMPTQVYPLFEQALRHSWGRTVDEHQVQVSELWSRFSEVAANNPHAWVQRAMTPTEIRTPSPANRWISWPYTKVMNANNAVEQSAAVIVTSVERARALGIPRDRWVFPWAAIEAHDTYAVSHRADLASSPAIRLAGRQMFELAGVGPDEVAHVDLYSCFPSAVEVAATELGFSLERPLTVTGGLSFSGGPWNNYVSHSIAAMVAVLRDDPGAIGLVSANGGYLTKHALTLYSTEPPAGGFRWASAQDEVDALPHRELCEQPDGAGEIESWVVSHDREGQPERTIATVILDDGRRAWADNRHSDTLAEMTSGAEYIGRRVKVDPDGTLLL
ncbi:MAG: acetyl-CoA acetyltransferase [Acidimicrobiales bacterium]